MSPQPHGKTNRSPLIHCKNISLSFNSKQVLENVEFVVFPNEMVTLIGPNGAGKSTLLKILLGIIKPSEGIIERKKGLKLGYVPQKIQVDPLLPISVQRFLQIGNPGLSKGQFEEQLIAVGAKDLRTRMLHTLSGGEFQRVVLARSLLKNPELLLLDEPVQGVDPSGMNDLYVLIQKIKEEKHCSIVLISHDLHLVMSSTDRVICLDRHICCSGHPDNVINDPAYMNLFGGDKTAKLAPYIHKHQTPDI